MKYIATNNAESTLASGIGDGDVTLTLTTGTGALFPSPGANEAFKLRLKEGATMEIVDCTSRLGDVCTVIRAREGTSASAFNAGASVVNTITAEHLMSKIDIASNVFSCDNHVSGTTNKVFTATEQSKLAGIAAGAEVNVNADWNAGSGDAQILNKPSTFAPSSHNNSAHSEPFGIVYYGTGAPPTAVGKSDGTLYFKYTP